MTSALLLATWIIGTGGQDPTPPSTPHWPLVPDSLFAINGIVNGAAQLQHVSVALRADSTPLDKVASDKDVTSTTLALPSSTPIWRSLEILFTSTADGTLAKFGGISIVVKSGHIWFSHDGGLLDIAPIKVDSLNDIQLVKQYDSLLAYVNGERANQTITPPAPLLPLQVGLETWKGTIIGVCGYYKVLSGDEVIGNLHAGQVMSKALYADTKTVTVDAELGAMTAVPELSQIAPYRSALVAEEYTILNIAAGRMSALKTGMKIRIFRWGLKGGDKTDVAKIKTGDKATMTIQPLSADPKYEKEFQVDTLDGDISALYFVDITPAK